jgi:2-polyprenyl-6-methoxyphenol hydroxylase-like FAD-dependent oxidoreductase
MLPSAGLGAVNAMHDAVVLVNCFNDMPDASSGSITAAFQEYYRQRHHRLEAQTKRSSSMTKTMGGQVF